VKNTPAYSTLQISFWTLAGVEKAEQVGDEIVGRFRDNPRPFCELGSQHLFEEYANWPSDPQGVLRFTMRYGPLEQCARPQGSFCFALRRWQWWQKSFQENWEHLMPRHDVHAASGLFAGFAGDRGWDYDPKEGLRYRAANFWEYLRLSLLAYPKERLKKCARPGCENPYFAAKNMKQTYCSERCARSAQQQWKKQWWNEHGNKWRATRRRERKASKGSPVLHKRIKTRR
jgi:hypothetical protein